MLVPNVALMEYSAPDRQAEFVKNNYHVHQVLRHASHSCTSNPQSRMINTFVDLQLTVLGRESSRLMHLFLLFCRPSSDSQNVIIGSLPRSDALRYRCHTILALQRVMAHLHAKAASQMPAQSQLQLLAVLQVLSAAAASLFKLAFIKNGS